MNLVQLGTTASRANRGKSVNDSIAESYLFVLTELPLQLPKGFPRIIGTIKRRGALFTNIVPWSQRSSVRDDAVVGLTREGGGD
jgi:hypothetical protein